MQQQQNPGLYPPSALPVESAEASTNGVPLSTVYQVYPVRWWVLFTFSLQAFMSNVVCYTLAPGNLVLT